MLEALLRFVRGTKDYREVTERRKKQIREQEVTDNLLSSCRNHCPGAIMQYLLLRQKLDRLATAESLENGIALSSIDVYKRNLDLRDKTVNGMTTYATPCQHLCDMFVPSANEIMQNEICERMKKAPS